jgi:hypothetical protein
MHSETVLFVLRNHTKCHVVKRDAERYSSNHKKCSPQTVDEQRSKTSIF